MEKTKKEVEQFGIQHLTIIPPQQLKMVVTTVRPVKDKKNILDVTYQVWYVNWN